MPAPHEIIASPLTLYVAEVGTAFPKIDAAPAGAWLKLGALGAKNYTDDGVTVTTSQTVETFIPAGSTAPRKAFRTEEGLAMGFTLVDLSPEQFAKVLDEAAITTVVAAAGKAGEKSFSMLRGLGVQQYALLARGESTVDNELASQYEWPTVYQSGDPSPVYTKGEPAGLDVEFTALEVEDGEFGDIRIQTAEATE
jgi:hypothetical protein